MQSIRYTLIFIFLFSIFTTGFCQTSPQNSKMDKGRFGKDQTDPEQEITINLPNLPENSTPLTMVCIPAGSFKMGCYPGEPNRDSKEEPQHQVNINYDFYLGKYEITIGQYREFLLATGDESGVDWSDSDCPLKKNNGDYQLSGERFGLCWDHPMIEVSWHGAKSFTDWLTRNNPGKFRLPSEAEWEYACRAGTSTQFYWGDDPKYTQTDNYAWYSRNTYDVNKKYPHVVGQKAPNAFGLYDMSGNVFEWCQDYWHYNYTGAPTDGSAWKSPTSQYRVIRGGAWCHNAPYCRSAFRDHYHPDHAPNDLGFRIVRKAD